MRAVILYHRAPYDELREKVIKIDSESTLELRKEISIWIGEKDPMIQYVSFDGVLFRAEQNQEEWKFNDVLTGIEL